ncbi:Formyl-coenzyme A transferase (Formyl-CoA transferase) [Frankia alni ACN14a]|uniref:Formyl-coenzyme A transferase (Formyl-CoA transferase) n=2 Tax=Frankiaceae TaxID=74712 RepID=Q0RMJ0_FRAAA|nr:Formyl-coenzyme A transferase (Formyl-CoA transferase) [Frankia alni ACN14a]
MGGTRGGGWSDEPASNLLDSEAPYYDTYSLGMFLADLDADVIKVEAPPRGDYLRYFLGQLEPGYSVPHLQVNKNKRSIALDVRADAGREVFWRLLDGAESFLDG